MPITEIPPRTPVPLPSRSEGGELYDSGRWESAYRDLHVTPELVIQLQDDLSRSRQREAFWISLIVHILLVIAILNSNYLEKYLGRLFPKSAAVIAVNPDLQKQKDLTYLELPRDLQKIMKPPKTNIISDKNRIAHAPKVSPNALGKILDSERPGARRPPAPVTKPQSASPPAAAQQARPQPQERAEQQPPQPKPNQMAALQTPPQPRPSFRMPNLSAGSAIEQAARAAIANRGSFGGDGGDFGLDQGQGAKAFGNLDVLSDTMGVDFGPYLARVLHDVKENWYRIIPESAMPPILKKGKVSIEFAILKNGQVAGMRLDSTSGDVSLDRAAWGGITASSPFPPLPSQFGGQYLALRFRFYYNPDSGDLQ